MRMLVSALALRLSYRTKFRVFTGKASGETLDTAVGLSPIGYLGGNAGQLAALAPHDATDEGRQGCQVLGHAAAGLARITLF